MTAKATLACLALTTFFLLGCSLGDLRAFNDALSAQNGYQVTYPDQSDSMYVGDIKVTTGVKYGEGFQKYRNTGSDYCKVKVIYEDDDYDYLYLDPYESTSSKYMSIYNQVDTVRSLCNSTSAVFNERME